MSTMTITQEFQALQDRYPEQIQAEPVKTELEREIDYWRRRCQAGEITAMRYLALWEGRREQNDR